MSTAILDLHHGIDPSVDPLVGMLPEQDWCDDCTYDDDPYSEIAGSHALGMPRDVVERSIEVDTSQGPNGPEYEVTYLACGHTLAMRC